MTNPLVAAPSSTGPSPWAGVWIAEDIEQIVHGVQSGSWIDGTLGAVSAGLDALAFISDPIGGLLQYGIAWLIEHVRPLSEALDWLAGDPAQIAAHAQTWRNVAGSLRTDADDLIRAARFQVSEWTGAAADAYQTWADRRTQTLTALARAADGMALITEGAGLLIGTVRTMVRDAVATVVSRLITYAAELLATAGLATPVVAEQVTTLCAAWGARIAHWLKSLIASLRKLGDAMHRLADNIRRLHQSRGMDDMGRRADWRGAGERPQPPTRPPNSHLAAGDPIYHREGATAIGYDVSTMRNFDAVRPLPGYHDVVVHGEPNGLFRPGYTGADGHHHPANFTHPQQIADAIRNDPHYDGGPVRLVSCHTGRSDVPGVVPAGQQVADALGVPVMAPTNAVGVPGRGRGTFEPTIRDGGTWVTFEPRSGR
ncbi:WXG100 family type VII secretion target [Actinoplanes sp. NPDC049265]|uniref:WXG100 family type VII secretion target n=1 Tax=Actinoplanes sp. NPDC049265 TaxID=3363902 RepID=UPI00371E8D9A